MAILQFVGLTLGTLTALDSNVADDNHWSHVADSNPAFVSQQRAAAAAEAVICAVLIERSPKHVRLCCRRKGVKCRVRACSDSTGCSCACHRSVAKFTFLLTVGDAFSLPKCRFIREAVRNMRSKIQTSAFSSALLVSSGLWCNNHRREKLMTFAVNFIDHPLKIDPQILIHSIKIHKIRQVQ